MTNEDFKREIMLGIPAELPEPKAYDTNINHAPKRKEILNEDEKRLALRRESAGYEDAAGPGNAFEQRDAAGPGNAFGQKKAAGTEAYRQLTIEDLMQNGVQ